MRLIGRVGNDYRMLTVWGEDDGKIYRVELMHWVAGVGYVTTVMGCEAGEFRRLGEAIAFSGPRTPEGA